MLPRLKKMIAKNVRRRKKILPKKAIRRKRTIIRYNDNQLH